VASVGETRCATSDPTAKMLANRVGQPVAERVERRAEAEGNAGHQNTRRAQDRIRVSILDDPCAQPLLHARSFPSQKQIAADTD
jgi:hypothetical protein